MRVLAVLLVFVFIPGGFVVAQDESGDENWREFCDLTAANVVIWPGVGDNGKAIKLSSTMKGVKPFERLEKPVFEHKNPFNRDERGLVYLWKQENGRPVAIFTCLVFKKTATNRWNQVIEHHSLHDKPVLATYGKSTNVESYDAYAQSHLWKPKTGIEWKPVPEAPSTAKTAALIRIQGRSLIRRFACKGVFSNGQSYHLKAQTTPVYKYSFEENGEQRGGLLTFFCRATDPEALLLLEYRNNEDGKPQWHYAVGNFTIGKITFMLDKKQVWEEISDDWFDPTSKHYGKFPFQGFTIEEGITRQKNYQN